MVFCMCTRGYTIEEIIPAMNLEHLLRSRSTVDGDIMGKNEIVNQHIWGESIFWIFSGKPRYCYC